MLETIHEYAREKLKESGEADILEKQHALYFTRVAEEAEPHLYKTGQVEWLNRLDDEYDNLRAALRWARERGSSDTDTEALEIGLRIVGAIWRFWITRGYYSEGREQADALLSIADGVGTGSAFTDDAFRCKKSMVNALLATSGLANRQWGHTTARSAGEQALVLATEVDDKPGMALALNLLGNVAGDEEDHPTVRALFEESIAIRRELGDKRGVAAILYSLAGMAYEEGNYTEARKLYEQTIDISSELGNKGGIGASLDSLGTVAYAEGNYTDARSFFERSLEISRELGDKPNIAFLLSWLGNIAWREGNRSAARALYEQGVEIYKELGETWRIAYWFYRQGLWAFDERDYQAARSLFRQSLATWKGIDSKRAFAIGLTGLERVMNWCAWRGTLAPVTDG